MIGGHLHRDIKGFAGELLRHLVGEVEGLHEEVGGLDVAVPDKVGGDLQWSLLANAKQSKRTSAILARSSGSLS